MTISKEEARKALQEISNTTELTRRAIIEGCSAPILILWGVIWILCYGASHFFPENGYRAWLIGAPAGGIGSWILGMRFQASVSSPHDFKIGMTWLVLLVFATVWTFLLMPFGMNITMIDGSGVNAAMQRKMGAYGATLPMFLYVVGGMWFGRFFVYLGILITAATLVGYLFISSWFYLWMAVTGGGAFIASGVFIRKFWK